MKVFWGQLKYILTTTNQNVQVYTSFWRPERASDTLELELWAVASCQMWVLRTKLGPRGRAVRSLHGQTLSLPLPF